MHHIDRPPYRLPLCCGPAPVVWQGRAYRCPTCTRHYLLTSDGRRVWLTPATASGAEVRA